VGIVTDWSSFLSTVLSLHVPSVFVFFLVLWLSAVAGVLQVLLQMLEIIVIDAVRQSCGQLWASFCN